MTKAPLLLLLLLLLAPLAAACGDDVGSNPSGTGGGAQGGAGAAGGGGTGGAGAGGGADCPTDEPPAADVAITDRGAVRGQADGDTVSFLGMPYAEPPIGALRFAPPEPVGCYDGVLEAADFGDVCVQADGPTGEPVGDEDCLTLNVWTPAVDDASRPVMVFIHGGGNIQGSASQLLFQTNPIYTGRHLAEQGDVVVVTIQYRLGPFGFLPLPELVDEGDDGRAGNAAILDQLEALAWVQRNAAAFGGDPGNVTIFGESAGGVNVCALMGSPLAAGLFHRAAVHSGACVQPSRDDVIDAFSARVDEGSCAGGDRLSCLRDLDATALLEELGGSINAFDAGFGGDPAQAYGPLVDGVVLPESTDEAMIAGTHNAVPFVVGSNAEEMAGLLPTMVSTEQQYQEAIASAFLPFGQTWVDQILATYPAGAYPTPQDALYAVFGDLRFTCPTEYYAQSADTSGRAPVYRYWFARQPVTATGSLPASHGLELLFVFGSLNDIPAFTPDPVDTALSEAMIGYWTRFAATGDPNGAGAPTWPSYAADDPHLVFDATIDAGAELKPTECAMWEAFYDAVSP